LRQVEPDPSNLVGAIAIAIATFKAVRPAEILRGIA
jgi:hypothetical protein